MINITTLQGAKDVLSQYPEDEYCVIYAQGTGNIVAGFGYWLVEIVNMEESIKHNELFARDDAYYYSIPIATIAKIPKDIIYTLIDEGYLVLEISEKEWNVQEALGTAPQYRRYLINVDEIKEKDKL